MAQFHEGTAKELQRILARGPKVGDSNLHGFTRSTLETFGVQKDFLKKAVKAGYVHEIQVRQTPKNAKPGFRAPVQAFYAVEVIPEPKPEVAPPVEAQAAPVEMPAEAPQAQV